MLLELSQLQCPKKFDCEKSSALFCALIYDSIQYEWRNDDYATQLYAIDWNGNIFKYVVSVQST